MANKKHNNDFEQGDLFACCQPDAGNNECKITPVNDSETENGSDNMVSTLPARPVRTVPMPGREKICSVKRRRGEELSLEAEREWSSQQLKEVREKLQLSYSDVEAGTRVWTHNLRALENCDYDSLPQPVYVLAYVRKLCAFYKLEADETAAVVKPWLNIQCEIPENLAANISPDTNSETKRQQKRLELIILAVMGLILISVIAVIVVVVASCTRTPKNKVTLFKTESTLKLQDAPKLQVIPVKGENHR